MLKGTLKYIDASTKDYVGTGKTYEFGLTTAEFPNVLWMALSTTVNTTEELIDVNKLLFTATKENKSMGEDIFYEASGSCRIDIASTIKTNALNMNFAARVGSAVRYALSIPARELINEAGDMRAKDVQGEGKYNFLVEYHCSVPTKLICNTKYCEISIEMAQGVEVFPKLQEKNKWGTKISATPISNISAKFSDEYLGFNVVREVKDDIPDFGLRQTIEEVIEANPDKNTAWILDRHYVIVNKDNLDSILKEFLDYDGLIAFDTETTGLDVNFRSANGNGDTIVGLSLSYKAGTGYYFPLGHKKFENLTDDITDFMQTKIKPILEGKKIICHNTSFDWKVAYLYGINTNVVFDTFVAFNCTYRYKYGINYETGLKALARNLLGLDMFDLEDFVVGEWGSTDINFSDLPYELVRRYATADADMTLSLYEWLVKNDTLNQFNATRVHDLEVQFSKVVAYSEYWGYCVDMERLPTMIEKNTEELNEHMQNLYKIAGHEFNVNSPQQLKKIMYDELHIEKVEGKDSTGADILKELSKIKDDNGEAKYPFAVELLAYRNNEGTNKNFIKKRNEVITPDGFIFPHVYQFGTDTGRVSIKNPNYQSYDKLVKHYIVPRPDFMHFDCDYSQIEYRVLASMAGQQNLCDALADPDMDYHTYQAARMFNVPYASVTSALRKQSKGINFGLPYGMEDKSLGKRIFGQVTPENTAKAAQLRKKYFQGQEKIQQFFEVVRAQGVAQGYTETWLGRRRYYNKQSFDIGSIRRQAGNHVIQGCLDGDTVILTKDFGKQKIKDIVNTHMLVWNGTKWTNGDILYSGKKQKCIIHLNNGETFICSPIHKFLVKDANDEERWVECKNLAQGYRIAKNEQNPYESDEYTGITSKYSDCITVKSVEITSEYIDMYDVCNTDEGYYVADGIITHNTAADIYKMGVVSMFDMICRNGWLGKVLINAFVHDEILVEIHKSINPYEFLKYWREEYQVKLKGFCQLYAGAGFGENWYVAKSQDLPPAFIQECIDKADTMEWDEDIPKFLKKCNEEYFDYKVRRVRDYITDKANDNQVIKPLINALLLEVTAVALNISEKELTKQCPVLSKIIEKFVSSYSKYFYNDMQVYNILSPNDVKVDEAKDVEVNIPAVDRKKVLIEQCKNSGMAVDVENMVIYVLFINDQKVISYIMQQCNDEKDGYKLKLISKKDNDYVVLKTEKYIRGSNAKNLQIMYRTLRGV